MNVLISLCVVLLTSMLQPSTHKVRQADLILVIDHGKIVEQGSHEELLKMRGAYHALYTTQLMAQEKK